MGETFSIVPTSAIRYNLWTLVLYLLFRLFSCKTFNATVLIFWFVKNTAVKASQICCYYWFNGLKKLWLRNLHTAMKCRCAILHIIFIWLSASRQQSGNLIVGKLCTSVRYWRSRLLKAMGQLLMLYQSMVCFMREIKQLFVACRQASKTFFTCDVMLVFFFF